MKFDAFCLIVNAKRCVEHHHFEFCIVSITADGCKIEACDTEFYFASKDIISMSGIAG